MAPMIGALRRRLLGARQVVCVLRFALTRSARGDGTSFAFPLERLWLNRIVPPLGGGADVWLG